MWTSGQGLGGHRGDKAGSPGRLRTNTQETGVSRLGDGILPMAPRESALQVIPAAPSSPGLRASQATEPPVDNPGGDYNSAPVVASPEQVMPTQIFCLFVLKIYVFIYSKEEGENTFHLLVLSPNG